MPDLENPDGGRGNYFATYRYVCGDNLFVTRESTTFFNGTVYSNGKYKLPRIEAYNRQIQCTQPNNNLYGGIRLVSATLNGQNGVVAATSACFGRGFCTLSSNNAADEVAYRCGSSNAIIRPPRTANRFNLTCQPDVVPVSVTCDPLGNEPATETRCVGTSLPGRYDTGIDQARTMCPPGNNGSCRFSDLPRQTIHVKWQCGKDPKVYSYDGLGEPAHLPNRIVYIKRTW